MQMKQKKELENWKITKQGTIVIDWSKVENAIGFKLHENFKDLYSRIITSQNQNKLEGIMEFNASKFVKEYTGSREGWLKSANGRRKFCEFTLYLLQKTDNDYVSRFVKEAFCGDWTGGNDFGNRAYIGELFLNIGEISIIFHNDTGKFEWVDFGYGYFDIYEENPYGVIADTVQEFLDKFKWRE